MQKHQNEENLNIFHPSTVLKLIRTRKESSARFFFLFPEITLRLKLSNHFSLQVSKIIIKSKPIKKIFDKTLWKRFAFIVFGPKL